VRRHIPRVRPALAGAVLALGLAAPAGALAASAPGGCAVSNHHLQSVSACITTTAAPAPVGERLGLRRARWIVGTASFVQRDEYGCWFREEDASGTARSLRVAGDHTATATYAMASTLRQPAWTAEDPGTGEIVCSDEVTATPLDPWILTVQWRATEDPAWDQLLFSRVGWGDLVPSAAVVPGIGAGI
jgi:hypothetical protein